MTDPAPCVDCGEEGGGRYSQDGLLVCWPCYRKRTEGIHVAEAIDRENGISYAGNGNGHNDALGRQLVLRKMAEVEPESVRWAWDRRVVLGMLNVVVGEPGLGKSTLIYDLAAKVSRGELQGDLYGQSADVLVVTYEDHIASVVRPRLELAGADLQRVHEVAIRQDDTEDLLTLPNDMELIREAIEGTRARLLTVDPIVASLPGEINSHRDQDVRRVLAPLSALAERYDLAVVVVMHVNKSRAREFLQRVGASVGFTGAARSMLLVARDPDDPEGERGLRRVLAHGKCNVGPLARSLRFEIESAKTDSGVENSRLRWCGECETTTADLLGADGDDERLEIDEACDFLVTELGAERRHSPKGSPMRRSGVPGSVSASSRRAKGSAPKGGGSWSFRRLLPIGAHPLTRPAA